MDEVLIESDWQNDRFLRRPIHTKLAYLTHRVFLRRLHVESSSIRAHGEWPAIATFGKHLSPYNAHILVCVYNAFSAISPKLRIYREYTTTNLRHMRRTHHSIYVFNIVISNHRWLCLLFTLSVIIIIIKLYNNKYSSVHTFDVVASAGPSVCSARTTTFYS